MNTPIADFVRQYAQSNVSRLHMPGHKGRALLGCEPWDITEIAGADSLYEADGIIAQSERNAAALFGSGSSFYSTEGSSHCIKAMLHLIITLKRPDMRPVILAARNVHKAFISSAALIGFDIEWLWPKGARTSLCACPISPEQLDEHLSHMNAIPAAVYVTSPDYLGSMQNIRALAQVCHRHNTRLAVDNAHGAYLHFCQPPIHPLDLGADICCDSAHKTLPVLTGGAYLHLSKDLPEIFHESARSALSLYGSTSPSYLILCSLDLCNQVLAGSYAHDLQKMKTCIDDFCAYLKSAGWQVTHDEPMKVTLHAASSGTTGQALAKHLHETGIEIEYADRDDLVMMMTPMNDPSELNRALMALGTPEGTALPPMPLPTGSGAMALSTRDAVFAPREVLNVNQSLGRICAAPTVACPPAIPIAVPGEIITEDAIALFKYYGVSQVAVVSGSSTSSTQRRNPSCST